MLSRRFSRWSMSIRIRTTPVSSSRVWTGTEHSISRLVLVIHHPFSIKQINITLNQRYHTRANIIISNHTHALAQHDLSHRSTSGSWKSTLRSRQKSEIVRLSPSFENNSSEGASDVVDGVLMTSSWSRFSKRWLCRFGAARTHTWQLCHPWSPLAQNWAPRLYKNKRKRSVKKETKNLVPEHQLGQGRGKLSHESTQKTRNNVVINRTSGDSKGTRSSSNAFVDREARRAHDHHQTRLRTSLAAG